MVRWELVKTLAFKGFLDQLLIFQCLQEHHFHAVATEAKKFEDVAHEQDLSDLFETKIDEVQMHCMMLFHYYLYYY